MGRGRRKGHWVMAWETPGGRQGGGGALVCRGVSGSPQDQGPMGDGSGFPSGACVTVLRGLPLHDSDPVVATSGISGSPTSMTPLWTQPVLVPLTCRHCHQLQSQPMLLWEVVSFGFECFYNIYCGARVCATVHMWRPGGKVRLDSKQLYLSSLLVDPHISELQ